MTTPSKQQFETKAKDRSISQRVASRRSVQKVQAAKASLQTISTAISTPVLSGFYYAVSADEGREFTIMQVVEVSTNTDWHTAIKVRQFAPVFKVLPDYLIPEQLGLPVAQFWLPLDEFVSWQPLLMQRGIVASENVAQ